MSPLRLIIAATLVTGSAVVMSGAGAVSADQPADASGDPQPTSVQWSAIDGTCDDPAGTLLVSYDDEGATYWGDDAGSYPAGTTVSGLFQAVYGYELVGGESFEHRFSVADAPCEQLVIAAPPTFIDPSCSTYGAKIIGIEATETVTYEVSGKIAPGKSVTVTAVPTYGHELDPSAPSVWHHTFAETPQDCTIDANPSAAVVTDCGSATLTFSNDVGQVPSGFTADSATFTYVVDDGGQVEVVVAPNAAATVVTVDFDEDTGTHSVQIGGQDAVDIATDCEPDEVVPGTPEFYEPTCAASAAGIGLPDIDGIEYAVHGTPAPGATVQVTATPTPGHTLTGPSVWDHTFDEVDDDECAEPTIIEPTFIDPTTPPPAARAGSAAPTPTSTGQLPTTGAFTGILAAVAALVLLAGVGLVGASRRPRTI